MKHNMEKELKLLTPDEVMKKRILLENDVYAAVFPHFADIETPGQNAHSAAQTEASKVGMTFVGRLSWDEREAYYAQYPTGK